MAQLFGSGKWRLQYRDAAATAHLAAPWAHVGVLGTVHAYEAANHLFEGII